LQILKENKEINMKKRSILLLFAVILACTAMADEGMWLPSLLYKLNISDMQNAGCELSAEEIYSINNSSLKDAIVVLDRRSCTAEVISKDGLILTNHHCGLGEIQKHSSVDHDYLRDGFWAGSKKEELPNPGKTATFLISIEDVTSKVLADVTDDLSEEEREIKIDETSHKLEQDARGDTHYEVYVKSFLNSNQYFLFVTETFTDIRLVGAPPQALGKFGGDTDNWMWPRHTSDFSMFRVYCGPDGKPARYSEDNIPYQPKHFLPVSLKGVEEGDFAMIMGYPGGTERYKTSYGVNYTMQVTNPVRVEVREKKLEIIGEYMASSQKARIQYASKYARSSNYHKFSIGQNKGLKQLKVVAKKKAIEDEFISWVNKDNARKLKYGKALEYIANSYADLEDDKAKAYLEESMLRGPEIFRYAARARGYIRLLEKPEENARRIKQVAEIMMLDIDSYFKDYNAATDQKIAGALMQLYAKNNPARFHPDFFAEVQKKYKGDYSKYAKKMFAKSVFDNKEELTKFLKNPTAKILKKDMALMAAIDIYDKADEISQLADDERNMLSTGNRLFLAGLMEMNGNKSFYPDANSTMRLTYGNVLDYNPRDGVTYNYFTTSTGYLEKEIPGDYEFNVPSRMKELVLAKDFGSYADADGSLHTCFITNNDITGGNSGSPVLNAKGELIGIAFDGNWEAMSGDIAFEPELQRCINVDIRFVLWVIEKYAGATHLLDEMKIIK